MYDIIKNKNIIINMSHLCGENIIIIKVTIICT